MTNIQRSREQCKFTCNCRGATVYMAQPNYEEAESRTNLFVMPRRNGLYPIPKRHILLEKKWIFPIFLQ